ncbi:MAG TPA: D-glycero-beta-D-manno-heptose-7-phosphate kinase [Candidatus Dormibacteraeota bacterium]|nr:D-glycero-beta-D-manno-heptose-7-phosphate kinase [Candidatus Dormibacteraeota bacterium]
MPPLSAADARRLFDRMSGRRVLVVGDLMVDEWIWGRVSRISPEAPVPVVEVTDHSFTLGGAGNVATNLRALGARVRVAGVIGGDGEAERVRSMIAELGVGDEGLFTAHDRPTTRKTRIVAHNQQVVRADWERAAAIPEATALKLAAHVSEAAREVDAVIFSDYAKGLLSRPLVEAALASCHVVTADPKPANLELFRGVTCIAPNAGEAAKAAGITIADDQTLDQAGRALLDRLGCAHALVTRGEHGMSLFTPGAPRYDVPAVARTVFDVSGAGDTVVSVLTLALAAGIPILDAVTLANFAAGAVVEKLGTATASADEIVELMEHHHHPRGAAPDADGTAR